MTDQEEYDGQGVSGGYIGAYPGYDEIRSEYGDTSPVGDMRRALVTDADPTTIEVAAAAWKGVHSLFKDIPAALQADLDSTLADWEGDDADELRGRVEYVAKFGEELAAGLEHTAEVILPYVHEELTEAEMAAPYPTVFSISEFPPRGAGSRALTHDEKDALWERTTGGCQHLGPCWSDVFGNCGMFEDWVKQVQYPREREAMTNAVAFVTQALSMAMESWPAPVQPPGQLPGELVEQPDLGDMGPIDVPGGNDFPERDGTSNPGSPTDPGGPVKPPPPPPLPQEPGGGSGGDSTDGVDPDEYLPDQPPTPEDMEDFQNGELPVLHLPDGDMVLHPYAIALIPDAEWERMADGMSDELWAKLAEDNPNGIPPELAEYAPEHLFDKFPCNDPDWEPPVDEDGVPFPTAKFDPEVAEHMTPEMQEVIGDFDPGEGKAAWEQQQQQAADEARAGDPATRSWYQDTVN